MLSKIMKHGKTLILAYDQGLEHGPSDFNEKNIDPKYVLDIAKGGKFNAVVLHKGIAEKYRDKIKVPLIVKLNGKTSIGNHEPISGITCSVEEAVRLKASAVGFTIYIGSEKEYKMFREFSKIQEEAHKRGLGVIAWIYPRGKAVRNDGKFMAYAARVGLELGADIIKLKYNGNKEDLKWAVKCAGRARVVVAGGVKENETKFLRQVKDIMETGAAGLAIGRNIWQSEDPTMITKKVKEIIW